MIHLWVKSSNSQLQYSEAADQPLCNHSDSMPYFFLKNGPIPAFFVYFRSFHIQIQMTNIQFEQYKLKKA